MTDRRKIWALPQAISPAAKIVLQSARENGFRSRGGYRQLRSSEKEMVGVASPKEMQERLLAAARGEGPPVTKEAKIWVAPEILPALRSLDLPGIAVHKPVKRR